MSSHAADALPVRVPLREGLELVSPGGAFVPSEGAVVAADLHVGYAPALRAKGYAVPSSAGDDEGLLARVRALLERTGARRLVVAGDLVHGVGSGRRGEDNGPSAIERFVRALGDCALEVVLGNHDRKLARTLTALGVPVGASARLGPHEVLHGDDADEVRRARTEARSRGGRVLLGHLHPAYGLDGGPGARATVPAFVTAAGLLCLPALSPWARGGDVRSRSLREQLGAFVDEGEPLGVAAVVADRVAVVGRLRG